jgi:hypothetical protein
MHYSAENILPPTVTDIKEAVKQAMVYFCKEKDESEDNNGDESEYYECDWWDWYVIGGRWSGRKIESNLDAQQLEKFKQILIEKQLTVSGVTVGKQSLEPASQIPMVDALWREMFPGAGDQCLLFAHSYDQYKNEGYNHDVCTVGQISNKLTCNRLIICEPAYKNETKVEPARMWCMDYWNGCEHQDTGWDGNVKKALEAMAKDYRKLPDGFDASWLCVTVDYHN